MKRVFIVHGWDGTPQEGWFPWLKKELESRGFEVHVPQMPEAGTPRIYNWVPALAQAVGQVDEQTYFVGHSMGCQTIARYLETLPPGTKTGGAVFVAGFFKRLTLGDGEDHETEAHWLGTPLDFGKVREALPKSAALFCNTDPWVPLDNQDDFKEKLGSKIVIEYGMGHFSGSDGITELPTALSLIVEISS